MSAYDARREAEKKAQAELDRSAEAILLGSTTVFKQERKMLETKARPYQQVLKDLDKLDGLQACLETITPAYARMVLEREDPNRRIQLIWVNSYARDMSEGRWLSNGQPVIFSDTGKLLDGKHRFLACVKANVSFTTMVVRGVPDSVMPSLDTGHSRNVSNTLQINLEQNYAMLGATIQGLLVYKNQSGGQTGVGTLYYAKVSPLRAIAILDKNKGLRESVAIVRRQKNTKGITPSVVATVYHLAAQVAGNKKEADRWLRGLTTGANLDSYDPVLALRNAMLRGHFASTASHKLWTAISCYNKMLIGQPVRQLKTIRTPQILDGADPSAILD
jgi:hypothetical protein